MATYPLIARDNLLSSPVISCLSHLVSLLPVTATSSIFNVHPGPNHNTHTGTAITVFNWNQEQLLLNRCPFFRPWLLSICSTKQPKGSRKSWSPTTFLFTRGSSGSPSSSSASSYSLKLLRIRRHVASVTSSFTPLWPPRSCWPPPCLPQGFCTCPSALNDLCLQDSQFSDIYPMWTFFCLTKNPHPTNTHFLLPFFICLFYSLSGLLSTFYHCPLFCYFHCRMQAPSLLLPSQNENNGYYLSSVFLKPQQWEEGTVCRLNEMTVTMPSEES